MVRIVSICCVDITRNELAVAPHAALHVNKVVGVADGADALGDLLALRGEALVLLARRFHLLRNLLRGLASPLGDALDRALLARRWRCRESHAPA